MSTINTYYEQSLLSAAAYANLTDSSGNTLIDENLIRAALIDEKFSDAQADKFLSKYTLFHASDDSITGFDGALFRHNNKRGQRTIVSNIDCVFLKKRHTNKNDLGAK